jgi:RHS repeat-associated protein
LRQESCPPDPCGKVPGIDNKLWYTSSSTGTAFFLTDHLGSTRALVSSAGDIIPGTQVSYDSFGVPSTQIPTRFLYTGREYDYDTELYYYRARWYDPRARRFISEDPIGLNGGINLYAYVNNTPIILTDPSGLCPNYPIFCHSDVNKEIATLYGKAKNHNFHISAGSYETEVGFLPHLIPGSNDKYKPIYSIGGNNAGSLNFRARDLIPAIDLFHAHLVGSGWPSTPATSLSGSGDTGYARSNGVNNYVVSNEGLAMAPANGNDSYWIIKGKDFNDWYKQLEYFCKEYYNMKK